MQDIAQVLYEHSQKNLVPAYLVGTEYDRCAEIVERHEAALRQLIPEEGQTRWEKYLDECTLLAGIEREAHFLAGLSLGQQLSRL